MGLNSAQQALVDYSKQITEHNEYFKVYIEKLEAVMAAKDFEDFNKLAMEIEANPPPLLPWIGDIVEASELVELVEATASWVVPEWD